ncbi:MAG: EAL domain-containing protein [Leptolyngbyaceae cyanobacterium SM2_5_2]|nr:EAL domain-containing protein [Leptolyngbyaceae cyanobacterium SM2_5_2]
MRAAGFEVSLDDFGTGYSSLNYLERCEIDSLKIDQSFIQKICSSERAQILVSSIIDIAKKLNLPTVAEGIETPEQKLMLQKMGCTIGQGYLFSPPLPFEEALEFLLQG